MTDLPIIKKSVVEAGKAPRIDWNSIHAAGMMTLTQARKLRVEIEDVPCARYQGQKGYVMLYKIRPMVRNEKTGQKRT